MIYTVYIYIYFKKKISKRVYIYIYCLGHRVTKTTPYMADSMHY